MELEVSESLDLIQALDLDVQVWHQHSSRRGSGGRNKNPPRRSEPRGADRDLHCGSADRPDYYHADDYLFWGSFSSSDASISASPRGIAL